MAKNSVWAAALLAAFALCAVACLAQGDPVPDRRVVIYRIAPVYSDLARRCNLHGDVKLSVVVTPEGKVKSASVAGGNPVLAQAAVESVRSWKFAPAPSTTTEQVELHFGSK